MERVNVGMHVDIRRSDGRVHNAVISEVRKDMLSVTVEWFENGETKGKEIDLKALLAINPTLAAPPPSTPMSSLANDENRLNASGVQPRQQHNNNPVINGKVTSSLDVTGLVVQRATRLPRTRPSSAYGRRTLVGSSCAVGGSTGSFTTNGNADSACAAMDTTTSTATTASSIPPPVIRAAAPSSVSQPVRMVQPSAVKPPRFVLDPSNYNVDDIVNETITSTTSKSSTVQEIERLQRNREERRAHQVEVKKQKEQLRSIDPGNPNWQFLTMIREYQSKIDFRPLTITDQVTDNRITVCVRKRPLNRKEVMRKEVEVITIPNRDHVIVHQPQVKVDLTKYLENQKFRFDYTFDENSTNEMVYRFTAQPLLKTIFQQGVATCFAYGQTGSGKTHTMGGTFNGKAQDCAKGIYALTAGDVFKMLGKEYRNENLQVGCSFFEIYGGKVFDLISNKAMLRVLEDGKSQVQIVGLQEVIVANEKEVLEIISKGMDIRTAGVTSANQNSSRSHAVFQIVLRKKPNKSSQGTGRMWGKFSLIDLAGNERGVDTISSDTQTRMEGAEINKSLLALKECIRAMGRNTSHVPFRQSKLTLVLRDSFIGSNAKTCMIAMISPGMSSCEHTLNTLRYADRVKELGAEEGASTPMDDEQLMLADDGSDLEMTRSRNGMSEEAYREQKTLQEIAAAEERCLDELASTVESNPHAMLVSLMTRSSKVDYDMMAFANELMRTAGNYRDQAIRLYECAERLQAELRRDEVNSKERNSTKRH